MTVEVKEKTDKRTIVMPRPPVINIAGKVDGVEGRVGGGTAAAEVLSLAFTMKRRKDTPSSSGAVFSVSTVFSVSRRRFLQRRAGFFFPPRCTPLDSGLSSKFTLYRHSTNPLSRPLRGLY